METVLYNRPQVAAMLGCSKTTVDNLVARGLLSYTRRWAGGPKCWTLEIIDDYRRRVNAEARFTNRPDRSLRSMVTRTLGRNYPNSPLYRVPALFCVLFTGI